MKYYVIAGEASGDLHGSNLLKALKKEDPFADFRFWGGDLMAAVAGKPVKHIQELAFMGFTEVIGNIRTILENIKFCVEDIKGWHPDVVILIDYPGFNLRIAKAVKESGGKVFYYISPQVWAWKEKRVEKIKKYVDKLMVILPFEKEFYAKHGMDVDFVGHPLLDAIAEFNRVTDISVFRKNNNIDERPIIAILPGSRKQEIQKKLPIMLSVINEFPEYNFVIGGAPSIPQKYYNSITGNKALVVYDQTYLLLSNAYAAIVTSGTATLETGLMGIPLVVCYKGNPISYHIAKRLIKVDYISLVNLIMKKEIVKELIQLKLTSENLINELRKITSDTKYRQNMIVNLNCLKENLGGVGASKVTAKLMLKTLNSPS